MGFGFLGRILGKGGKPDAIEYRRTMVHNIVGNEMGKPMTETEAARELGIDLQMIEDDNVNRVLRYMSGMETKAVGADGQPIMDASGQAVTDGDMDLNMLATMFMTSKLIRTGYADPIDVEIAQAEAQLFVDRIELDLNEDEYELGGTNFLDALKQIILMNFSCAKNGRMAKLLKVTGKAYEIRMPGERKKKGEETNLL